jgi:hypothetical protein
VKTFELQIICTHCNRVTSISDWPVGEIQPILFTCVRKHGGCGGYGLVEPPDTTGFPHLEVAIKPAQPLTAAQARAIAKHAVND